MQDDCRIFGNGKSSKTTNKNQHHKFPSGLGYPKPEGKDEGESYTLFRTLPFVVERNEVASELFDRVIAFFLFHIHLGHAVRLAFREDTQELSCRHFAITAAQEVVATLHLAAVHAHNGHRRDTFYLRNGGR